MTFLRDCGGVVEVDELQHEFSLHSNNG